MDLSTFLDLSSNKHFDSQKIHAALMYSTKVVCLAFFRNENTYWVEYINSAVADPPPTVLSYRNDRYCYPEHMDAANLCK